MLGQSQEFKSLHRFHDNSAGQVCVLVVRGIMQSPQSAISCALNPRRKHHRQDQDQHQEPPKLNDTPISTGHEGLIPTERQKLPAIAELVHSLLPVPA